MVCNLAGALELASLKTEIVADLKPLKQGKQQAKQIGKEIANEMEKDFKQATNNISKETAKASKQLDKMLKGTAQENEKLTKSAVNVYREGYGKSMNDVVKSLAKTKKAMADLDGEELEKATMRAMELRDALGISIPKAAKLMKNEMQKYGSDIDQAFNRVEKKINQHKESWNKLGESGEKISSFGEKLTVGLTAPLVGLATISGKAAMDVESANTRMISSLGLTESQGQTTAKALKEVYSDGFGESIDDVADVMASVNTQLSQIPLDQIGKVTKQAMILRDTFGQDVDESLRGINSLMTNFGLSADEAMDLYVVGAQKGLDKTHELGDNLAEYGQIWAQAGFSAKQTFAILDNGLKNGAYNLDKVNDFVKEFTISLNDGRIEQNLGSFSEGTQKLFRSFKEGKSTSQDVFQSVIKDLENTKNQQEKLTLASTVWSALGEDNAMKIIESLNDVNHSFDDVHGAMKKVEQQQERTFSQRSKALFRDAQTALLPLGEVLLKIGEKYLPKVESAASKFANTLENMSDEDIERVLKIGGFVAIAGPTVVAIGKVTSGISKLGDILKLTSGGASLAESAIGGFLKSGALLNPWVLGAAGTITIGAVAWKAWGEEAWNSAQRTKRWGSDVGQATDEALTKVSNSAQTANGQFTLLEQGISSNTDKAVANFARMGNAIETEMTSRINALRDVVKGLPDDIKGAAEELMSDEIKRQEENLQIVKQNNEKITKIKKDASEQNREISYFEATLIKQYADSSARAYAESLGKSEKETKQILAAMTGNVKQASEEQAQSWLTTLAKQRQASKENYAQMRKNLEDELTNRNIDLNSKMAKGLFDLLEESAKTSTNTIEQQMAEILGKYPELANKIFLANGQIINANDDASQAMIAQNKRMMESFKDLTTTSAQSAEKNAKSIELQAKATNEYGEFWNNLVLDPKTGEIKTNAQEAINEAANSEQGWNQLIFASKDANLSSNAKLMIAEAAIANGKWESMTFTEQQALIKSNATKTITQALQVKGDWDNLTFEQKKAVLYSNTPEVMAETLMNLGLWDQYAPEIKELKANNFDFLNVINQSEEKVKSWGTLPVEVKELLAKNENLKMTIYESEEYFNRWNALPSNEKLMLANNQDALFKILSSEQRMNEWNALPIGIKQMYANNQDLLNKALQSEQSLNDFAQNNPETKKLLGDSSSVVRESGKGQKGLENYKQVATTIGSATLLAIDNASSPAQEATKNVRAFGGNETITKRFNIVASITGLAKSALEKIGFHFAKGSDGLPNDQLAVVNDQEGPIYEEMIIPPKGPAFIPEGRNVMLPLKKGTKIKTAYETRKIKNNLPHYARGTGENLPFNGYNARFVEHAPIETQNVDMLRAIKELIEKEKVIVVQADNREIARGTWSYSRSFANEHDLMISKVRGE